MRLAAGASAIALLLGFGLPSPGWAQDAPPDLRGGAANTPTPDAVSNATIDISPTGALSSPGLRVRSAEGDPPLDISPPPGLLLDPPPEAAPAAIDLARPPAQAVVGPAAIEGDNGAKPPLEPTPASTPEIASRPDASSSPEAPAAPSVSATPAAPADLPSALHAALDRLTSGPTVGRPIGAGDWSAATKAIAADYAERDYAPFWIEGGRLSERAKAAMARLARADEDGLDLRYAPSPAADLADADLSRLAEADIALSEAVVAYAMQASGARVRPRSLSKDVTADPEVADAGAALKKVAAAEDPDAALSDFNPQHAGYRELREALARLRGPKAVAHFSLGPELKLGMSDPRVPLIRARFGLGAASDSSDSQVYDIKVASAVAAFQRVHGLKGAGALTSATAEALETHEGNSGREGLILANMEMWRWEPRDMGETRVEVNVPDFSLKLMNGDSVVHRARVIVGKPDTPTAIFSNSIKYMLFNPVWRVPQSIIKKEMAPKLASDPNWLARRGYKVTYVGNQIEVEQPPGEANALGRMLFLFPNEHAIYLHDTPQRSLFSTAFRALSHGCVRVEDPARLAEILMGGAARGWTEAKVRSLDGDKERTLSLPTPVPIHLEYFTEFVDESGRLEERADLYGLTARVASALSSIRRD